MNFTLTVIIPVFNCEKFVEKAIQSVLLQSEVTEIIVINDGSTDATAILLEKFQEQIPILKIYYHPNKSNRGRSASRNLGIQKATMNYIAFLDADDFYLKNRFENDVKLFERKENCDGVYNAVGFHFYRDVTELEKVKLKICSVTERLNPEELFDAVICSKYGYLHLNGLTVKKSVFDKIGFLNESLLVAEDSDIIFKMALKCCLQSGVIDEPLALRGVHEDNVFTRDDLYKKYTGKAYESILAWSLGNQISIKKIDVILKWLWVIRFREKNSLLNDTLYWASLSVRQPKLLFTYLSVKYFPVIRRRKILFSFLYKEYFKV
ncbi:glycosyltransferase family 2 protein [Flavobacterium sp. XN-5]|uniref:glycosyltransferase family 2 protein n=1 Tax=Flavobacterium sp. XN-5 TaxID=2599390 RepID=UPI0013EF02E4|nr:glycosyltransferase family 2 protein [Flavobacterium sp. XN-5]NGY37448.1 glycosyltransferase family 2 protein [Flavobacterium sp. XN-5]